MDERAIDILQMRYVEILIRYGQLHSMLMELDEINDIPEVEEQVSLKETKVYMLIEQEMKLLEKEQRMIEKTGVLSK